MKVEENKTELPTSSIELVNKLDYWKISYKLYFHKPLMTVKESKTMQKKIFGLDKSNGHIKNLFLRDKRKKYIISSPSRYNYRSKITCKKYKYGSVKFRFT